MTLFFLNKGSQHYFPDKERTKTGKTSKDTRCFTSNKA